MSDLLDWLDVVAHSNTSPCLREPIKDPARLQRTEAVKVAHNRIDTNKLALRQDSRGPGMKTDQRRRKSGRPDEKVLAEIVQRVVEAAQPDKIILFGSAARGEMGPDSDIDLLVIKSGKFNHWRLLTTIYRHLPGIAAVDVVLASAKTSNGTAIRPIWSITPPCARGRSFMGRKRYAPTDPCEWINRAKSNLAGAGQADPDVYLEDLCFDAQQAAEKAIKAVFIHRGLHFPYVHNLRRLLELLDRDGVKIPKYVWKAEDLNPFAFEARYPGNAPPVQQRQYRRAVRIAESVVRWAERQIGKP